jgi:hypothetical protein
MSQMIVTAAEIREAETERGHKRTVVVGDLNMIPFEAGVCSSDGLHAVMCKHMAAKGERVVTRRKREFFYNPMWDFLGDETPGPPDTYFYRGRTPSCFWGTFDQVYPRGAGGCLEETNQRATLRRRQNDLSAQENASIIRARQQGRSRPSWHDAFHYFLLRKAA